VRAGGNSATVGRFPGWIAGRCFYNWRDAEQLC
jgi:hypothetical protein